MKAPRNPRLLPAILLFVGVISMDLSTCMAQSAWTQIADMPVGKHGHSASFLDGKLYVMGGIDHYDPGPGDVALYDLDVYDPVLDSWTEKTDMLTGRFNFSSCAYDGKILAIGGSTDIYYTPVSVIDAYDPLSDEWSTITHIPKPGVWGAAALLNEKIYIFGGAATESGTPHAPVQIYDLLADTWSEGAEMLTPRIGLEAVALNGKIFVMGGQDNSAGYVGMNTLEVYEPETNTWAPKTGMIVPRKNSLSCELNGDIYIFGGMSGGNGGMQKGGEVYDPLTDSWKELCDSPRVQGFCAGSPMNNKIYIGGGHSSIGSELIEHKSWYIYDPQYEEIVSIPDTAFLHALIEEGVDTNGDSLISYGEAEVVTSLDIGGDLNDPGGIAEMSGIEAFVNLDTLSCSLHQLTSLDVSACTALSYLNCSANVLESLNISGNSNLRELYLSTSIAAPHNRLTDIDISNSPLLEILDCGHNQLASLDISANSMLRVIKCSENLLTTLDISKNQNLTRLDIGSMPTLGEVCVWIVPFPPAGVDIDTLFSPNVYFKDCVAPDLIAPDTLNQPTYAEATSSEDGMIYLVPEDTDKDIAVIRGACIDSVEAVADTPVNIPLSGLENGVYWLYARDLTGNISEPGSITITGVGIENIMAKDVRIFPNPTKTILTIERSISDNCKIDITSLNGQLLFSQETEGTNHQLDLSSFQKGVYIITIRSKDYVFTSKIIKLL